MRYCTKCGNELTEKASLCDNCGCATKKEVHLRRIGKFPACFILLAVVLLINIVTVAQCGVALSMKDEWVEDLPHVAFNGFDTETYSLPSYSALDATLKRMDTAFDDAINMQASQSGSVNAEGSTSVFGGLGTYTVTVKSEDISKYETKYENFVEDFSALSLEAQHIKEAVWVGLASSAFVLLLGGFTIYYEKKMRGASK